MEPAVSRESRLEELERTVADLRIRLERLEEGAARETVRPVRVATAPDASAEPGAASATDTTAAGKPAPEVDFGGTLGFVGRTLIELGGAYLLRALTDSHTVSPGTGATLGLGLGAGLLLLAERDGRAGRKTSASFHGATAIAVTFPLLVETATRMHVLSPSSSALLAALFGVVGLGIAWLRRLRPLAWVTALFALGAGLVLARLTGAVLPFVGVVFVLAAAGELLAFDDEFRDIRWATALGLDLIVLQLVTLTVREGGVPEGFEPIRAGAAVSACLSLPVLYIATIGARTLLQRRLIAAFGLLQGPLSLVIGLLGAERVLTAHYATSGWAGLIALLLAASSYGVAFTWTFLDEKRARNFYFYATIGGLLALFGTARLASGVWLGLVWALLGLGAVAVGIRWERATLRLHGAILGTAAGVATGLLPLCLDAFVRGPEAAWAGVGWAVVAGQLILTAAWAAVILARRDDDQRWFAHLPPGLLGAVVIAGASGILVRLLAPLVAHAPGASADAGLLASLRTAVISLGAIGLAAAGRHPRLPELRWFVLPVLGAGALKIVVEDLSTGRPLTLFLTLLFYGTALVLAPRLRKLAS